MKDGDKFIQAVNKRNAQQYLLELFLLPEYKLTILGDSKN